MTESWPPPPTPGAPWHERQLRSVDLGGSVETYVVRSVRLWGREVLIDESNRVRCDGCLRFIPVDELGRIDNSHPVGLPYRAQGQLLRVDLSAEAAGTAEQEGF